MQVECLGRLTGVDFNRPFISSAHRQRDKLILLNDDSGAAEHAGWNHLSFKFEGHYVPRTLQAVQVVVQRDPPNIKERF